MKKSQAQQLTLDKIIDNLQKLLSTIKKASKKENSPPSKKQKEIVFADDNWGW